MPTTATPAEVHRLLTAGQSLTLLDVRTPAEFARVHALGAQSIPLDELSPTTLAHTPGTPLYLICQSGTRATTAHRKLTAAGITPTYVVEGGTTAWFQAGLPVHHGPSRVLPIERQVRISAGSLILLGLTLAWTLHPLFLALPTFVGAGLLFAGLTDRCGMALLLAKLPWNRRISPRPASPS